MTDWALGAGSIAPADTQVAEMPYRDEGSNGTPTTINMYLFSTTIPVDSSKTVADITLPSTVTNGSIGIFAISSG
jgi:hypothetical protein